MVPSKNDSVQPGFVRLVDNYPENYNICRDSGHHWEPTTAKRQKDGTISRVLTCSTCGADRNQTLDRDGYIIGSNYVYRTGYLLPGMGRLNAAHRAVFRLASVLREIK